MNDQNEAKNKPDWVEVRNFSGSIYAEMAREMLENNAIPCLLQRDFMSSAYGIYGAEVTGSKTRLFVPQERLEESQGILTAIADT